MLDVMQDDDGVIIRDGDLVLDGGIDGIAQQCEIRIGTQQGEWWLDESQGLPWIDGILGRKLPAQIVANMLAAEGMRTEGVTDIKIISAAFVGGNMSIRFAVYKGQEFQEVFLNGAR